MAYAGTTKTMALTQGAAAFASAFTVLAERFSKYRHYRQTYRELAELSPRELEDLGLSQHNLRTAAYEAVYGTR